MAPVVRWGVYLSLVTGLALPACRRDAEVDTTPAHWLCLRELCGSGMDADCDGLVDCDDPDCAFDEYCYEVDCTDGRDGDEDGLVDCDDPDCWGIACAPWAAVVLGGLAEFEKEPAQRGDWDTPPEALLSLRVEDVTGALLVWNEESGVWVGCDWTLPSARYVRVPVSESGSENVGWTIEAEPASAYEATPPCRPFDDGFATGPLDLVPPEATTASTLWYAGDLLAYDSAGSPTSDGRSTYRRWGVRLRPSEVQGECLSGPAAVWYRDQDGDGYGDPETALLSCGERPAGFVGDGGDCDDTNATIHPGAEGPCEPGLDRDCDGVSHCVLDHESAVITGTDGSGRFMEGGLSVVDVDGDGAMELLVWRFEPRAPMSLLRYDGPWTAEGLSVGDGVALLELPNHWWTSMAVADVTGDGAPDLVLAAGSDGVRLLEGPILGPRDPPLPIPVQPAGSSTTWSVSYVASVPDTRGDGVDDLLIGSSSKLALFRGGAPPDEAWQHSTLLGTGFPGWGPACGADFDADGNGDVAVRDQSTQHSVLVFHAPLPARLGARWGDLEIVLARGRNEEFGARLDCPGDVTGDGREDLWVADVGTRMVEGEERLRSTGNVYLFSPDGHGTDDERSAVAKIAGFEDLQGVGRHVATADLDGDGWPDLVVDDATSTWVVFGPFAGHVDLRNAAWRIQTSGGPPVRLTGLAAGDLDGDGLADLAMIGAWADEFGRWKQRDEVRLFFGAHLVPDGGAAR